MGSDDLFKKRREARKQRKHEYRTPKANSFLIVTEGEKTEPLYFKGLEKLIKQKVGGMVQVIEAPVIDIYGKGCSTEKLIEITEKIVKDAKIAYQNVWVVFDKDDFDDFDEAIANAVSKGYKVAWSNQAFEYWIYLHFNYSDAALHRDVWNEKLDDIFKQYNLGDGTYRKNYDNIYDLVNSFNGVDTAIKNAKRRMHSFHSDTDKPSCYDPGTTVHELVQDLKSYLDEE